MRSMTGFGRAACTVGGVAYKVEIRSLNHRFLDLRVRTPWNDADVDSRIASLVRDRVARGRLEVGVVGQAGLGGGASIEIDERIAGDLARALERLKVLVGCDLGTAARLVPPLPELLRPRSAAPATEEIWPPLSLGLEAALDQLEQMRLREGEALKGDILGYINGLKRSTATVLSLAEREPQRLADRLHGRLAQLSKFELDRGRLAQEAAILAERSDVSEELARLSSHLEQLSEMVDRKEPVGRAMEFMQQELNRELNTIASKSASTDVTSAIVEAKGLVEKMREQTQNVE